MAYLLRNFRSFTSIKHLDFSRFARSFQSSTQCSTGKDTEGPVHDVPYTVSFHRDGQKKVTDSSGNLPESADVVVIGGGSLGCSTAYHLAKMNAGKVIMLEKSIITSGTTWHTAGILWNLRYHSSLIHMQRHTRELLSRILPEETGFDAGWIQTGAIFVTKSQTHLDALEQISLIGRDYGTESHMVTPSEISSLHPLMNTDGLVGGVYSPQDGSLDPATLCTGYIKAATKYGAKIYENCEVENVLTDQDDFGFKRVVGVKTNRGTVKTNNVINCTGAWAPYIAKMVGLDVPHATYKHAYVVTQSIPGIEKVPHIRDVEGGVYHKRQGDALLFGGYERDPELVDIVEKDFSFGLYDLDWERFEPHMNAAIALVPKIANVGIRSTVCGPETFTPDGNPIVGESPEVRGFFFGSGFNSGGMMMGGGAGEQLAHWVLHGEPEIDMKFCDVNRFSTSSTRKKSWLIEACHEHFLSRYRIHHPANQPLAARNIRTTPLTKIHLDNGAYMIESHGWEVPAFYHPEKRFPLLEYDYYGIYGHEQHERYAYKEMMERHCSFDKQDKELFGQIHKEVVGSRDSVGLFDISHLSKFTLSSPDAARLLFTSDVTKLEENSCVETLMLTKQGKILTTALVWKDIDGRYSIQCPSNMQEFIKRQVVQCLQDNKINCKFADVTDRVAFLSLMGPKSRQVLLDVVSDRNVVNDLKEMETTVTEINGTQVCVLRFSFVAYGIQCDMDDLTKIYDALNSSDIKPVKAGFLAMESLEAEAGQHQMLGTYLNYVNPIEANLINLCEMNSERNYIGKEALMKLTKEPLKQQLMCFTAHSEIPLLAGNAVWRNGSYAGKITTAHYGFNMKKYIAYGYVKMPSDGERTKHSDTNYAIGSSSKRITCEIHMP